MSVEQDLEELLQQPNSLPVLFVGSGLSLRYLKAPTWAALLERFAADAGRPMPYYRGKAGDDLPAVASLLAEDFFEQWFTKRKYQHSRREQQASVRQRADPLKFEIAKYLRTLRPVKKADMVAEVKALKSVRVHSVITTNWDTFLEESLPHLEVFVGQQDILFAQTQAIGEIYKIHGSVTDPSSMVLTAEDYEDYWAKNPYLIAKMLTMFVEHPVIFLGYSLTDPHIQRLLGNLIACLTASQVQVLNDRLVFVRRPRTPNEVESLNNAPLTIHGHSVNAREVVLSDFGLLYKVLNGLPQRFDVSLIRRLKHDVYELAFNTPPTGTVHVVDIEDDTDLDKVQVVIGVGIMARLGEKGYAQYDRWDVFRDMLKGSRQHDVKMLTEVLLPEIFKGAKYAPICYPLYRLFPVPGERCR
ncbi:SIR2 family protein [Blastococcus sp. BMG 814]|uniref:SIR2 family protein n=1 Tax=Blastococcus carthaginiensis TaxID=3050034 RepID=A0ABT9IHK2_9ACTN|nr:SIR2 family protein [Blastococcus carthaginiensis]MDP5185051.1 SIR2 family protein [Blastococcus carthaginiensis]